jgi:hypothetical protein
MYDRTDPRATLAAPTTTAMRFAGAEYARFYDMSPQVADVTKQQWFARGQNFVLSYADAQPGAEFRRERQPDEYVVVLPDMATSARVESECGSADVPGGSIVFVPPGRSSVRLSGAGRVLLLWTTRSADLCALCVNAASYEQAHPNIPPFEPWPQPPDGLRLRHYCLDVADEPGRFGRIWRCTTFMVNLTPVQEGPRDITKLSPHHHDSFEQGSFALDGAFTHHIRWPWVPDMNQWRADDHELCDAPSLAVIPPPAVHTSRGMTHGVNQLIDIFSPPRLDFSMKPGWVMNASDYPMPG